MRVLRESDYVTVPWKNGGGLTREILKVPADAADFDWRLSLATIAAPGPFSAFEGYDRTLLLVRGAGVELDFGTHRGTLQAPGQMVVFDGAWPPQCALLDGPSTDLNLIVARTRVEAVTDVLVLTAPEPIHTSGWEETLICCVSGSAKIENASGERVILSAVDVARCDPGDAVITCQPHEEGPDPTLLFVASLWHRPAI